MGAWALVAALLGPAAASAAGITKGPWVQRVGATTATVRVEVDPPAPVSLEVGLGLADADGGHRVIERTESRALHTIVLTDLLPGTRYAYAVRSGTASRFAAFVTAPPDDSKAPFKFLVYGDNRTDDAAHASVVRGMVPVAADFLVHTGDFVENGASAAQWQSFFEIEAPLLGQRCLFSAVGNHELTDGAGIEYARFFGPSDAKAPSVRPEHLAGTFRWGNARFFLLNGMVSFKSSVDRQWLDKALADADAEPGLDWRIVVTHFGPWSSGPHGNNHRLHEANIPALLREHHVDLVLSGHDHIYERGWGDGIAYIVSGGGGAPTYRVKAPIPQAKKVESVRHFVEVGVGSASLQIAAIRVDGSTIERCSMNKGAAGWDCGEPAAPAGAVSGAAASSGSLAANGKPASAPPSRCSCRIGEEGPARAGLLLTLAAFAIALVRRRGLANRSRPSILP